jgi:hypothetical protein
MGVHISRPYVGLSASSGYFVCDWVSSHLYGMVQPFISILNGDVVLFLPDIYGHIVYILPVIPLVLFLQLLSFPLSRRHLPYSGPYI